MNRNKEQIQYFSTEDDGTLIKIIVSAVVFHVVVVAILFGLNCIDMSKPSKEIPVFEMVQVDQLVRTAEAKPVPPEPEPKPTPKVEKSVEKPVEKVEEPPEPPKEVPEEQNTPEPPPVTTPEPVPEKPPTVEPEPVPEKELSPEAPKSEPLPEATPKPEEVKPEEKPKPEEKKVEKPAKKPVEKKKSEQKPAKKAKEDDDFDIGDLNLKKSFELPSLKAVNPIDMDPLMQVFLERAKAKIMSNFNPPNGLSIPQDAKTTVQFSVMRSGEITGVLLKRSSSNSTWDHLSMRAVKISRLPELPPTYSGSSLVLQFNFTPN
jgi:hypothetical protein